VLTDAGHAQGEAGAACDYRDLSRAHPNNTVLLKLSYWLNP
jgi:hypothetical protein